MLHVHDTAVSGVKIAVTIFVLEEPKNTFGAKSGCNISVYSNKNNSRE